MRRSTSSLLGFAGAVLLAGAAQAQKATEIYIPIGRSPGLSDTVTVIGTCTAVAAQDRTVTVRCSGEKWVGRVTEATRIFLDKSQIRQPNTYGTYADLKDGVRIEVKYLEGQRESGGACEWIKVQFAAPAGTADRAVRSAAVHGGERSC